MSNVPSSDAPFAARPLLMPEQAIAGMVPNSFHAVTFRIPSTEDG
jgi:hypothetical protein